MHWHDAGLAWPQVRVHRYGQAPGRELAGDGSPKGGSGSTPVPTTAPWWCPFLLRLFAGAGLGLLPGTGSRSWWGSGPGSAVCWLVGSCLGQLWTLPCCHPGDVAGSAEWHWGDDHGSALLPWDGKDCSPGEPQPRCLPWSLQGGCSDSHPVSISSWRVWGGGTGVAAPSRSHPQQGSGAEPSHQAPRTSPPCFRENTQKGAPAWSRTGDR